MTTESNPGTSVDLDAANYTLSGLRPFPVAITTVLNGRINGLMSLSAGAAAIVPEAPRVTISITKFNMSHDMILESGVFAMHHHGNDADMIQNSLDILMCLGGSSGRDGDKITDAALRTKPGVTGSPILLDSLSYVEGGIVASLDVDESTIFVADVVAAERFSKGGVPMILSRGFEEVLGVSCVVAFGLGYVGLLVGEHVE